MFPGIPAFPVQHCDQTGCI